MLGVPSTRASTLQGRLDAETSWGGEATLVAAVEEYEFAVDGPVYKSMGARLDYNRGGCTMAPLLLRFGALGGYRTWFDKMIAAFQVIGLPMSKEYGSEFCEVRTTY